MSYVQGNACVESHSVCQVQEGGEMDQEDSSEDGGRFYTTSQLADVRHDSQEAKAGDVK